MNEQLQMLLRTLQPATDLVILFLQREVHLPGPV